MTTAQDIARAHDLAMRDHMHTIDHAESLGELAAYLVKWDAYRKALHDLVLAQRHPECEAAVAELMGRSLDRRPFSDEME